MKRFLHDKIAVVSAVLLILIIAACVFAPYLTKYDYSESDKSGLLLPPCKEHILGTDKLGRDMVSRILYGGRNTLKITATAVLISLIGVIPGMLAGFFGGKTDALISRIDDVLTAVPTLLLVVLAECLFGWGSGNYKYAIGVALLPPVVKLTRSLVQNIVSGEYITAAKVLGVPNIVILFRHVLRNILPSLIVFLFHTAADALMLCTVMGYLGIGIQPPKPEWGTLVHTGYGSIMSQPLQVFFPCVPIVVSILALNTIGNAVRDSVDAERRAE